MTNQKHTVSTDALDTLGTLIPEGSGRDAIHLAVEPTVAGEPLNPGDRIKIVDGKAVYSGDEATGIVDPFLTAKVAAGDRIWLVVLPRTITSLRHVWSHPAFPEDNAIVSDKSESEIWMKKWAVEHLSDDYYGEYGSTRSIDSAYAFALDAGATNNIGSYENARDYIDNEWWNHWENITGKKGRRDDYFSCSC